MSRVYLDTRATPDEIETGSKRERGYALGMVARMLARIAQSDPDEAAAARACAAELWRLFDGDEGMYHIATGDREGMYDETEQALALLGVEEGRDDA